MSSVSSEQPVRIKNSQPSSTGIFVWRVFPFPENLLERVKNFSKGRYAYFKGRFFYYDGEVKSYDLHDFYREVILKQGKAEVLSLTLPPKELIPYFAVVKEKKPFILSKTEKLLEQKGIATFEEILETKYGVRVIKSTLSLDDLKGAHNLKRLVKEIDVALKDDLLRPKGVFLIGIPGTGKSYSCFCVAGELNRIVVELNVARILEKEKPIEALEDFFSILSLFPPSIVWIDEIDKVFRETDSLTEKVKGRLLTLLEDFNSGRGYGGDVLFWVTANDVSVIVKRNPEFFRRFDYLFFINLPKVDEAEEITAYYLEKYGLANCKFQESTTPDYLDNLTCETGKTEDETMETIELEGLDEVGIVLDDSATPATPTTPTTPTTTPTTSSTAISYYDNQTLASFIVNTAKAYWSKEFSLVTSYEHDRFVYTPAEIRTLVLKLARKLKLLNRNTIDEEILKSVMEKHYPTVIAYQEAISVMREQLNYFVEI